LVRALPRFAAPAQTIVEEFLELRRFVEHTVGTCMAACDACSLRRIVREYDHALVGVAPVAPLDDADACALLQQEINDGEVPLPLVMREPADGFVFGFGGGHDARRAQLREGGDQVFTDLLVVFYEENRNWHVKSRPVGLQRSRHSGKCQ